MTGDPNSLAPGFVFRRRGTASYSGALRLHPGSAPVWSCKHDHLTAGQAVRCAETELASRQQGQGEVFTLLHCEGCRRWWDDAAGITDTRGVITCPQCAVPLLRLKVVVTERGPAVDEAKQRR